MDRQDWLRFGIGHLREASKTSRRDIEATIDEFRGLSPYDQHAWYIAAKGVINALVWIVEVAADSDWLSREEASSPAYFAQKVAVYRALAVSMDNDLAGYGEAYQEEFDVKEPPPKLTQVRAQVAAFRDALDHVIAKAPPEIAVRM